MREVRTHRDTTFVGHGHRIGFRAEVLRQVAGEKADAHPRAAGRKGLPLLQGVEYVRSRVGLGPYAGQATRGNSANGADHDVILLKQAVNRKADAFGGLERRRDGARGVAGV